MRIVRAVRLDEGRKVAVSKQHHKIFHSGVGVALSFKFRLAINSISV